MIKKIFFIAIIFTTFSVYGQETKKLKNHFNVGVEYALPQKLFGDVYSAGIGFSLQENFSVAPKTDLTLHAGFKNYFLKSTYGGGSDQFFPVLGGFEQTFLKRFFVSAQLGFTFRTHGLGTAFTYTPGIGIKLGKNFSALIKYIGQLKSAINSSAIGLRAAYIFGD